MFAFLVLLISFIIEAMVVVFPDPVGPVTKTKPLCISTASYKTGGKFSCSISGTILSTLLNTTAEPLIVLKKLALNLNPLNITAESSS